MAATLPSTCVRAPSPQERDDHVSSLGDAPVSPYAVSIRNCQ